MKIRLFLLCIAMLMISEIALARSPLKFTNVTQGDAYTLDNTGVSFRLTNNGTSSSELVQVRVWASLDATFNNNDTFRDWRIRPLDPGQATAVSLDFKLPIPDPDNRPLSRIKGDKRTPLQWIGNKVYTRACLADMTGAPVIDSCSVNELYVVPIPARNWRASNGISKDYIEVTWPVPAADGDDLLADNFILRESQQTGGRDISVALDDPDLDIINDPDQGMLYRYRVRDVNPGEGYYYYQLKTCLETQVSGNACAPSLNLRIFAANSLAKLTAVSQNRQSIEFSWNQFLPNLARLYQIERCLADQPTSCDTMATDYSGLAYTDLNATPDVDYVYRLYACEPSRGAMDCENLLYIGVTNEIALSNKDNYERDDSREQAQVIRNKITQTHSLHTGDDSDWVRFTIPNRQIVKIGTSPARADLSNRDLDFELYDLNNQLILETTLSEDDPTSLYAAESIELERGTYFVRFFQPPPQTSRNPLYAPLEAYRMTINIRTLPIMTPINYLLDLED